MKSKGKHTVTGVTEGRNGGQMQVGKRVRRPECEQHREIANQEDEEEPKGDEKNERGSMHCGSEWGA